MTLDAKRYRNIIGQFATGVTIVTTAVDGWLHGMTANAITSVSLDPLLLLVCVDKEAHTHDHLNKAGAFTVNILGESQEDVSNTFAASTKPEDGRLQGFEYRLGANGAPILEGCLSHIECKVTEQTEGGDHTIFIGQVLAAETYQEAPPLLFYQGKYRKLG
jgi:flavin reductase (DIM6/NTAB) family NADH-FMN oxidoreductase RutF